MYNFVILNTESSADMSIPYVVSIKHTGTQPVGPVAQNY